MTANNIEFIETTVIVEISSQTDELVENEMVYETDEVKRETKALIEALRRRAETEVKLAACFSTGLSTQRPQKTC